MSTPRDLPVRRDDLPRVVSDRLPGGRRVGLLSSLAAGVAAGAAGTTALNAVTYLDMAVRARSSSSAPQDVVCGLADKLHVRIPGDDDAQSNRVAGLGPLTGLAAGVLAGAAVGALHSSGRRPPVPVAAMVAAIGAMAAADGPIAALGISDPTTWGLGDWLADAVPHLVYGVVTAVVADRLVAGLASSG